MQTERVAIDPLHPAPEIIARAAAVLRGGGLVAFPTETVYGLGANALDERAVQSIFAAKGRPPTNPLIVHVPDLAAAVTLVSDMPAPARALADRFWPGPLSLVLLKSARVPDVVTAGGPTVALRAPAHPVALALLQACGFPLAAPSANPSTHLSPTTADHVLSGLDGKIDMVLDAGPAAGGLESTVLDLTVSPPRLLRPGLATRAQIEAVIGPIGHGPDQNPSAPLRSPGMHERHYAPRAALDCQADSRPRVEQLMRQGVRVGWIVWSPTAPEALAGAIIERLPADAAGYAAGLYAALHRLDQANVSHIVVDLPPAGDAWLAVHDRLRRAAHS
ncbi:MAG: threonylcarbamoyl-AMP synthase [Gemmataceae bacterium]|nr:threonylcarbamoyl-AMP synthase [Gemmataceae bacterium]